MGYWLKADIASGKLPAHRQAGLWGRSLWTWHILAVEVEPVPGEDGPNGGSLCGRYLNPPYYEGAPSNLTCGDCRKLRARAQ